MVLESYSQFSVNDLLPANPRTTLSKMDLRSGNTFKFRFWRQGKKTNSMQGPINENWSWRKYESLAVCLANGTASNLIPHILGPLSWFNLSYHIVPAYLGWSRSSIKNITHSTISLYRNPWPNRWKCSLKWPPRKWPRWDLERSVADVKMTAFVIGAHSTPPPHSTEICEMSGRVLLKGKTSGKNVRI